MDWKPGTELGPDQYANPIRWVRLPSERAVEQLPKINPGFFLDLFGPGKARRIKTWGHVDGPLSAHYLAMRGGTTLHTDPAFSRYSVQMQLYNDGFYTHGLDEDPAHYPIMSPGVIIMLDTHSPHKVVPDPRVEMTGLCKLTAVVDSAEEPDPQEAIQMILERITDPPRPEE